MFFFLCLNQAIVDDIFTPRSMDSQANPISSTPKQNQATTEINSENKISVENLKPLKLINTGFKLRTDKPLFRHFSPKDTMAYDDRLQQRTVFTNTKNRPSIAGKRPQPRSVLRVLPVEKQESEINQEESPYCIGCGMYLQKEEVKPLASFTPNMVNLADYLEKCQDQRFSEKYPSLCKEIDTLESNFDLWKYFTPKTKTSAAPSRRYKDSYSYFVNNQEESQTNEQTLQPLKSTPYTNRKQSTPKGILSTKQTEKTEEPVDDPSQLTCTNASDCAGLLGQGSASYRPDKNSDGTICPWCGTISQKEQVARPSLRTNYLSGYAEKCKNRTFYLQHVQQCKSLGFFKPPLSSWKEDDINYTSLPFAEKNDLWGEFQPPSMGATGGPHTKVDLSNPEMLNHAIENGICDGLTYFECLKKLFGPGKGSPVNEQATNKESDSEENFWSLFFPPKAHADELHNSKSNSFSTLGDKCKDPTFYKEHTYLCMSLGYFIPTKVHAAVKRRPGLDVLNGQEKKPLQLVDTGVRLPEKNDLSEEGKQPPKGCNGISNEETLPSSQENKKPKLDRPKIADRSQKTNAD
ncbi:hypothetical protein TVAG_473270 [Trichomonas vaginalis G3]|uniref:Uncharacterized protein n=1 Tax=Trichomonas vaginalis (strain ATCC PRA-98 / G3) TaxID=412133 RepID=A2EUE4_TRIV3|nr:hypothetical protein TVAGG3_0317350 [Trichomonas vaginalis G3]EAY03703.1 hypothetical protein TVAG_473270 [Trichomonas vaginalis G3]KAI5529033.1 hypothetical protein TVAGG3_0317350 [Trichomonas vaginalis G3]|eukprot:XP_001315926.1 hypothetical protein [Trichomonas vaginalis G3]